MEKNINRTVLENGMTIISEHIPAYRSVSVGLWIKTGSRQESASEMGIVHFIEHMLFKGTQKRSALQIASIMEDVGGSINAFTGKEETCFFTHSLDTHLELSINVLADMVFHSLFSEKDIEMEKKVVLEEINMVKDTPDEYVFDLFQEKCYPNQPLGFPILGTQKSVLSFTRKQLLDFWKNNYVPQNMILSVSGNVDHNKLCDLAGRSFTSEHKLKREDFLSAQMQQGIYFTEKEALNQSHICIGGVAASYHAKNRFELHALNTYLGAGLSSRLFQILREKHGFVYSVFSFLDFYEDTGMMGFYMGTEQANQEKAITALYNEVKEVASQPIKEEKVEVIKEQLKGSLLLSMESTFKRMSRLAKNEIYFKKIISIDEITKSVNKISAESIFHTAHSILNTELFNTVILGPGK